MVTLLWIGILVGFWALGPGTAPESGGVRNPPQGDIPGEWTPPASDAVTLPQSSLLRRAWEGYQNHFIQDHGRVVRPADGDDTVSEGQAYALLLAALLDDPETFRRVHAWTRTHLSREARFGDPLLAWHWEPRRGVTDWNSASDADVDYALALILGGLRWHQPALLEEARRVLAAVLDRETARVGPWTLLLPGPWRPREGVVVNPSYFSPAHFRIFYRFTGDPRWHRLWEDAYRFLEVAATELGEQPGVGLVPDWVGVAPDGTLVPQRGFSTHTGWNAVRIPWRVALDALWFGEPRARDFLRGWGGFYAREWQQRGVVLAEYTYTGTPVVSYEGLLHYATNGVAFQVLDSPLAQVFLARLLRAFRPREGIFQAPDAYYTNSLALLALATLHTQDPVQDLLRHLPWQVVLREEAAPSQALP